MTAMGAWRGAGGDDTQPRCDRHHLRRPHQSHGQSTVDEMSRGDAAVRPTLDGCCFFSVYHNGRWIHIVGCGRSDYLGLTIVFVGVVVRALHDSLAAAPHVGRVPAAPLWRVLRAQLMARAASPFAGACGRVSRDAIRSHRDFACCPMGASRAR